jgi:segregation and condensation protein A
MQQKFTVGVQGFNGPLELLLDLIEKRELAINDISLASVADDYIKYLEDKEKVPVEETAHFVLVASTLLLIKSRSLLPEMHITQEEEEDIRELTNRLNIYRQVRRKARMLKGVWNVEYLFAPLHSPTVVPVFTPAQDATISNIQDAVNELIAGFPPISTAPTAKIQKEVRLEDIIERLEKRVQTALSDTFSAMTRGSDKMEAIVSFLALLELFKRGAIQVAQAKSFEEIEVHGAGVKT